MRKINFVIPNNSTPRGSSVFFVCFSWCELLCFIKPILGNCYCPRVQVSSRESQGGRTHDPRLQTTLLVSSRTRDIVTHLLLLLRVRRPLFFFWDFLLTAPPSVCVPDVIGALDCGFQTNFCPRWCLVRVRVKDGRGETKVSQWTWKGAGGVHKGLFQIPAGMVVRGGRRQSICQPALNMSQTSIFPRQRGCYTPDTVYHQRGDWQGRR